MGNFKVHDWLMVGAGAVMLTAGLVLDWSTVDTGFGSVSGDSPFNYFLTGGISWLLVVAVGVLALLNALGKLPPSQPWSLIMLGAAGLAALLMIIRIIVGGRSELGIDLDRGPGMYVAALCAIVAAVGAFLNFQAGGGDISDLTDMNKLKKSFSGDDAGSTSTTGGDTQPPPPPPPAT